MLEPPQAQVVQLGLEVFLAVLPPGRTLDRLVLPEGAVEEQLRGLRGPGAQEVEHHGVRRGELGIDGELTEMAAS